jgi:hypothetical protein
MRAFRWGLVALAAAILPSCGRHSNKWLRISVHDEGTVSAEIWAEAEYWYAPDDNTNLTVNANQTAEFRFGFDSLNRLKVRIYRSSDGLKILDETWSRDDLEALDEHLSITIAP